MNESKIISKLGPDLEQALKDAHEVWRAVALMSLAGVQKISKSLSKNCIQHYLVGIDLPTQPEALALLAAKQDEFNYHVRIFSNPQTYHPKVYLVRKKDKYQAFVGSANATNGGLNNNIELTIAINTNPECLEIETWFESLYQQGDVITTDFLLDYKATYDKRKQRQKDDKQDTAKQKKALKDEVKAIFERKDTFVSHLKKFRKSDEYLDIKKSKAKSIKRLKATLDYPSLVNIDLDAFFGEYDLGHIIAIPKPRIKKALPQFRAILNMLFDEQLDIAIRFDTVFSGKLKFNGISKGLMSKLLTMHDPKKYFVANGQTDLALKEYGINLPRGLSKGEKYKVTRDVLSEICKESGIENLAILDHWLYETGNKIYNQQKK